MEKPFWPCGAAPRGRCPERGRGDPDGSGDVRAELDRAPSLAMAMRSGASSGIVKVVAKSRGRATVYWWAMTRTGRRRR